MKSIVSAGSESGGKDTLTISALNVLTESFTLNHIHDSVSSGHSFDLSSTITIIVLSVDLRLDGRKASVKIVNDSSKFPEIVINELRLFSSDPVLKILDVVGQIVVLRLSHRQVGAGPFQINFLGIGISLETISCVLQRFYLGIDISNCGPDVTDLSVVVVDHILAVGDAGLQSCFGIFGILKLGLEVLDQIDGGCQFELVIANSVSLVIILSCQGRNLFFITRDSCFFWRNLSLHCINLVVKDLELVDQIVHFVLEIWNA